MEEALVEKERDALAAELIETYPRLVDTVVSLFDRIGRCDKDIDLINRTAPRGETRRLRYTELHARGLDYFSATQPSLAKAVHLPFPGETSRLAFPPADYSFAVQAADQVHAIMATRSVAYSDQWHEAKKLDDDAKIKEWNRRNAILEEQQEAAKREYIAAQKAAARGK